MEKWKNDKYLSRPALIYLGIVAILLLTSSVSLAESRQIAQNAFRSVVLLVMEDANSQPVTLGSGFFVKDDIVATNLHVIDRASTGYAKIVGQTSKYKIAGLVGIDAQNDLALLKITGAKAPSLTLGEIDQVAVGDEVYAVGNPQGLEGTFSQGIVSGIRQRGTDTLFQITAPISPGSSGGPVLNVQGKVIGIAVATFSEGQNLNFAIPASYLATLLLQLKPLTPLSAKTITKQKSIIDDISGKNIESVTGGQLIWTYSNSGKYTFSLRNHLREPVRDIYCLVVFYDREGNPVDVDVVQYNEVIPAGLAKRYGSTVDGSVQKLTSKIEFRILNFKIGKSSYWDSVTKEK